VASVASWLPSGGVSVEVTAVGSAVSFAISGRLTIDRASLKYARKVFVDGFIAHRDAYKIDVPTIPLSAIYGEHAVAKLRGRGVRIHAGVPVRALRGIGDGRFELTFDDDVRRTVDQVITAVPWRKASELLAGFAPLHEMIRGWQSIAGAPISGVHLWFDRKLTDLPHAVLVGTLSQWFFAGAQSPDGSASTEEFYCQVVVSASYDLEQLGREAAIERITGELRQVFPEAREAKLLRSKIVTERCRLLGPTGNRRGAATTDDRGAGPVRRRRLDRYRLARDDGRSRTQRPAGGRGTARATRQTANAAHARLAAEFSRAVDGA
jgi:hypothetical protein